MLAVSLRGAFRCACEAIRRFLAEDRPGSIVHQVIPRPGYLDSSVSKGGMMNLTRTLALEYGVRVNGTTRPTSQAGPSSSTAA